jgi:ribosome-associated protein
MAFVFISPQIQILLSELDFSFVRSSGPGGQNVNKVNTKAVLRWNAHASRSLKAENHAWIINRLGAKLTQSGDLIIMSDRFRDQIRNREDCLDKFKQIILAALHVPKRRKETKPSFSSKRRAQTDKKKNSQKKSLRKNSRDYE